MRPKLRGFLSAPASAADRIPEVSSVTTHSVVVDDLDAARETVRAQLDEPADDLATLRFSVRRSLPPPGRRPDLLEALTTAPATATSSQFGGVLPGSRKEPRETPVGNWGRAAGIRLTTHRKQDGPTEGLPPEMPPVSWHFLKPGWTTSGAPA